MSNVSLMTRNAKSFWRWIKNIKAPKSIIPEILHRGQAANSDAEKADIFNNFFCLMFTREDTSALADLKAQRLYSLHSITTVSISADDVFRELYRIDHTKSSGPDSIPGRLLKEGAPFIDESFDTNNVLSNSQHGFRAKHSCLTQLLESIHHWACSLDRSLSTHILFLDFTKAFDSVPHSRLLLKLEAIGI